MKCDETSKGSVGTGFPHLFHTFPFPIPPSIDSLPFHLPPLTPFVQCDLWVLSTVHAYERTLFTSPNSKLSSKDAAMHRTWREYLA